MLMQSVCVARQCHSLCCNNVITSIKVIWKRRNRSSFLVARWQQQFAIACFGLGSAPQSPLSLASGPPSNTMCHWTPKCSCQMASKSVKRFKCGTGDRAFSVAGPVVWNSIPAAVREADTVSSFKRKLKTHFFFYVLRRCLILTLVKHSRSGLE